MRKAVTLFASCALVGGIASAQYKPKPAQQAKPGATSMTVGAPTTEQLNAALANVKRISEADANRLVTNGSAVLVDVRSQTQWELGHIKGAVHIPGSQLISRIKELPPGKLIIAYCA